jgi:hypothetical protein
MRALFIMLVMLSVISCSNTSNSEYRIEMTGAKRMVVKVLDLYPDYKGEETNREVIEITILSKKNFIEESQRRGMTLYAYTGLCSNFEHIPTLASMRVYSNKRSAEYYSMGESPKPDAQGMFPYKIYLGYAKFKTLSQEERFNLCTEFGGSTYLFGYKSNRIKLDFSQVKFD